MSNIYNEHLSKLRAVKIDSTPAVTLYIPLRWSDFSHSKLFALLVKAANDLLIKNGNSKLEIVAPDWDRWIKQGTVTLGLFHHKGITTLIPLPMRMQPRVVVANSFHVKPIISAAVEFSDALLLHFNEAGASLYRINPVSELLVESYLPSEVIVKSNWPAKLDRESMREFLLFLQQEIRGATLNTTKLLGITGSAFSEFQSETFWKKNNLPLSFYADSFRSVIPSNAFSIIRLRLSQMINEKHLTAVTSAFGAEIATEDSLSVRTLGQKIINKEISHLCVSLDDMHFGELDVKTGNVSLNKGQANTRDDDILDDLVELALDNGIQVSVVPKKYLPNGRSFVAS